MGGLVSVFVCGCCVGAVKPPVRPCVEGRDEDECGECDALGGESEDEDGGEGVHGGIFSIVILLKMNL